MRAYETCGSTRTDNTDGDVTQSIATITRDICELPDCNSPDDWPEAMIVTPEELAIILERELADFAARITSQETAGNAVEEAHACAGNMSRAFEHGGWLAVAQIAEDRGDFATAEQARSNAAALATPVETAANPLEDEVERMLQIEPLLGASGPEPSLRELIRFYYAQHGMDDPARLAEQYVAAIRSRTKGGS